MQLWPAPKRCHRLECLYQGPIFLDRKWANMGSLISQDSILQLVSCARNTLYESGCGRVWEFTCRPTKEISGNRGYGLGESEHDCASPKSAQAMATHARIVLSCGRGRAILEVARRLSASGGTV